MYVRKLLALLALAGAFTLTDSFAQNWPARPVTLVARSRQEAAMTS